MDYNEVLARLQAWANPQAASSAARGGIRPKTTLYGVPVPELRKLSKQIRRNHALALQLWESGIHEARLLATMIADPKQVTDAQMDTWAADFDSWDICDQCCGNLFDQTPFAYAKAIEWSSREEEFVKRAGFALMAYLALHDKRADDSQFLPFFPVIQREATDGRNFVKKAVDWALRNIGKRNLHLNKLAIETAQALQQSEDKIARWVGSTAFRELTSEAVQQRLLRKEESE